MHNTLIQMALLMFSGACWGIINPNKLSAQQTRLVLTSTVYYFFLPAMVLDVLWQAEIGKQSLQYSLMGCSSMLLSILVSWLVTKLLRFSPAKSGAVILAASFANVTYLGLPVLEQTYGSFARSVVIQMDLFATAPLVYTVGIIISRHYGSDDNGKRPQSVLAYLAFFNAPPFWAAALAIFLNLNHITAPEWFSGFLHTGSTAVPPLMIFSMGLALNWRALLLRNLPYVTPILLIKLLFCPAVAWALAPYLFCDRYHLDSSLYATAVTISTLLSLFTLPFWYQLV
jgi:hypothetical protein